MSSRSLSLSAFKELTRHLLNNMMGHISLPAILQRVVQVGSDSDFKNGLIYVSCFVSSLEFCYIWSLFLGSSLQHGQIRWNKRTHHGDVWDLQLWEGKPPAFLCIYLGVSALLCAESLSGRLNDPVLGGGLQLSVPAPFLTTPHGP